MASQGVEEGMEVEGEERGSDEEEDQEDERTSRLRIFADTVATESGLENLHALCEDSGDFHAAAFEVVQSVQSGQLAAAQSELKVNIKSECNGSHHDFCLIKKNEIINANNLLIIRRR